MNRWIDFLSIRKVLVVKLRHHGDVLLTSPVFSSLKKAFPHLQVDAYLYKETLPMLSGHFAINRYFLFDSTWKKRSFFFRWKNELQLLLQIKREKYDLVLNLTEGDRGVLAATFSRCRYLVGMHPRGKGMWGKKRLLTHLVDHGPYPRHTVEKNLDALRVLGLFPSFEDRELFFHIPQEARDRVDRILEQEGVEKGTYVHVHPVSRWMFKSIPVKTMVEILTAILKEGKSIVLTGSSNREEMGYIREIKEKLLPPFAVTDLSGKLTLKELAATIETSQLLLSVDSMPLHVASALQKKVVAIFGPTCEKNWAPYRNPNSRLVVPDVSCRPCYRRGCGGSGISDCLTQISGKKILKEVFDLLSSP